MGDNKSIINIVRIGSSITYSSLKEIGTTILGSFKGIIDEYSLAHHDTPMVDSIDALLLTKILHEEIGGHILGITDADLKTNDEDTFYNCIIGGKNPQNDVAVVSTKKLSPDEIHSNEDYDLFIDRTIKVSLHEVGHNLGLLDHGSYKRTLDGSLCPMSKGEFNRFGYLGYVRAIIDGRGLDFCEECTSFLKKVYSHKPFLVTLLKDGLSLCTCKP